MAEFDSVIPAGGSGKLTAKVKTTPTQYGNISKTVSVTTDATGAERLSLNVRFTAVASIEVLPRPYIHLSGIEGDQISESVLVRRRDGKELKITGIDNHDQRITVSTHMLDEDEKVGKLEGKKGDIVLTVTTPPGLEAQGVNGRFHFTTNHPDVKRVMVNYALRLRPLIEPRPSQVRLILQDGNESGRSTMFRLQHNRGQEFKITSAVPSNPELFTALVIDGDSEEMAHNVAVTLAEGLTEEKLPRRVFEKLVLNTDDQASPQVEVPVLIEPRTLRRPGQARPLE